MNRPVLDPLPGPPLESLADTSLFFDLDGTLIDLIDRPEAVVADEQLRHLLSRLTDHLEGRVAIVSGRSLSQLDDILGDISSRLAMSGSHGCEHRWRGISAQPKRPLTLDTAAERFRGFVEAYPEALVEEKSFGVALHYRGAPDAGAAARAYATELAAELGLTVQEGKMVVELRDAGGDKGAAVRRLMGRKPMRGTRPIFVGDDITDEDGFEAARALGGYGVLVGPPRPTAATYGLPSPGSLHEWLGAMLR